MLNAAEQRRQAFSIWLRTGRVAGTAGGSRELKFNPWHDTKDGRFTFSGAGRYFGPGGRSVSPGRGQNKPRIVFTPDPGKPRLTNREEVDAWAAGLLKDHGNERGFPEAIEAQRQRYLLDLTRNQPSPVPLAPPRGALSKVADFATGFRDGVADVGKATATGLYALATTNPATSAKNIGSGIAHAIDAAIAAEDTPAYVQLRRAAHAVANASSHDVGHAFGTFVGSGTLAAAPGAIVSKLSSANRVGRAAAVIESPSADVISKSGSIGTASEATTGVESGSFSWIHKERYTTNAKLRREWEQQRGTPWPEDAAGRKYEVSHEIALGDGGLDHVVNIYPRTRADHIQRHIDAGDFSRWAKRRTKMMSNLEQTAPDLDSVTPISDVGASSNISVQGALDKARSFIRFFDWGKDIISEYVGAHFEGIFSIFLFEINPVQNNVDRWVWVVVGDIPPAYITCEDAKNPYQAIDGYVGAMEAWVAAAREGRSVAELIPVNAPATPANAASLDRRLRFIDERLLPLLK